MPRNQISNDSERSHFLNEALLKWIVEKKKIDMYIVQPPPPQPQHTHTQCQATN